MIEAFCLVGEHRKAKGKRKGKKRKERKGGKGGKMSVRTSRRIIIKKKNNFLEE